MNVGKTLFAQIMDFLPWKSFHRIVVRYRGDHRVRTLSCAEQYRCMAFAQLTYRESLRDIEACLSAQAVKLYHMGFRQPISRSTLADANEARDWRIYADFAQVLIAQARKLYAAEAFGVDLSNTVYALDATTIDLCLSVFPWAPFRSTKAAVKLHTLLDLRGAIPTFIHVSDGRLHDVNVLDLLIPEPGAFYVMDRGYLDFERRVKVTEAFTEEIMRFVAASGDAIRELTSRADAEWVAGDSAGEQVIASRLLALSEPVDGLVGAIGGKVNPRSGKTMRTMVETTAIPTSMSVYDRFVSTATRRVPAEYIVPASGNGLHDVVERKLREHGIQVESLGTASRRPVEQFTLTRVRHADPAFQGHHETSIEGAFGRRDVDVPAGSLLIRTQQPLGRLVFYLLEPESDDSLTTWNLLDEALKPGSTHPIMKSVP